MVNLNSFLAQGFISFTVASFTSVSWLRVFSWLLGRVSSYCLLLSSRSVLCLVSLLYLLDLTSALWLAGRLSVSSRHPALLPVNQLLVDAGWGFLPTHSPGVCLHLRGATGKVARGSRLDSARSLHPGLLSAAAHLQRQRTVSYNKIQYILYLPAHSPLVCLLHWH